MLAPTGWSLDRLRQHPRGVTMEWEPGTARHEERSLSGHARGFATETGLIQVYSEELLEHGHDPLPSLSSAGLPRAPAGFPIRLGCAKLMAYCHSQHRNIRSLRQIAPDPALEMSPALAGSRDIGEGDWVLVRTPHGSFTARARLMPACEPGSVFAQHGWWAPAPDGRPYGVEGAYDANMNSALSGGDRDPVSGSLPLRHGWCEIESLGTGTGRGRRTVAAEKGPRSRSPGNSEQLRNRAVRGGTDCG